MGSDTWKGGNGNWNKASNWSAGVPTSSSIVIIDAGDPQVTSAITVKSITIASDGELSFGDAGASTVIGAIVNSGSLFFDSSAGQGGSSLAIGGALTNGGTVDIGSSSASGADDLITTSALNNFQGSTYGTLDLFGDLILRARAAIKGVVLDVKSAAGFGVAGELLGQVNIDNTARIEFASGQIEAIEASSELTLYGSNNGIEDAAGGSALQGLTSVVGSLALDHGASMTTTGKLTNFGDIYLDASAAAGGSKLKLGGALVNEGSLEIGNSSLLASDEVTATKLINDGVIDLFGDGAVTSSIVASASVANDGFIKLHGDAETFASAVSGTGSFSLDTGSTLDFGSSVGRGQMVTFIGADKLRLESAPTFAATIMSFGTGDRIAATTFGAQTTWNFHGLDGAVTLNLIDGALSASLTFSGDYVKGDFSVSSTAAGTLIKFV